MDSLLFKKINEINPSSLSFEIRYFEIEEIKEGYIESILNPYKKEDILIESIISTPSLKSIKRYAYYKCDYKVYYDKDSDIKDKAEPLNKSHFLISYRPQELGIFHLKVKVYIKSILKQELDYNFSVENKSFSKGLIKVLDNHFIYSNTKETFIPVGENVAWYSNRIIRSFEYDEIFKRLREVGANYVRIWLRGNNFSLHMGEDSSAINFTVRMAELERLDRILNLAKDLGIYINLCLLNHGQFSTKINPEWERNSYKEILDKPEDFFKREDVKDVYKDELRYIISRYSEYDSIMSYELFNEVDWTDSFDKDIIYSWQKEMSEYLKTLDYNDRLITTSFMDNNHSSGVFDLDSIDYHTIHSYAYNPKENIRSLIPLNNQNKPLIIEEWGVDWRSGEKEYKIDKDGLILKGAIYASIFKNYSSVMPWWWDSYIDRYDLYHVFKAPFKIASMFNLDGAKHLKINTNKKDLSGVGIDTNKNIYIYLYNNQTSSQMFEGVSIDLKNYGSDIRFYDPETGDLIRGDIRNMSFLNELVIIIDK